MRLRRSTTTTTTTSSSNNNGRGGGSAANGRARRTPTNGRARRRSTERHDQDDEGEIVGLALGGAELGIGISGLEDSTLALSMFGGPSSSSALVSARDDEQRTSTTRFTRSRSPLTLADLRGSTSDHEDQAGAEHERSTTPVLTRSSARNRQRQQQQREQSEEPSQQQQQPRSARPTAGSKRAAKAKQVNRAKSCPALKASAAGGARSEPATPTTSMHYYAAGEQTVFADLPDLPPLGHNAPFSSPGGYDNFQHHHQQMPRTAPQLQMPFSAAATSSHHDFGAFLYENQQPQPQVFDPRKSPYEFLAPPDEVASGIPMPAVEQHSQPAQHQQHQHLMSAFTTPMLGSGFSSPATSYHGEVAHASPLPPSFDLPPHHHPHISLGGGGSLETTRSHTPSSVSSAIMSPTYTAMSAGAFSSGSYDTASSGVISPHLTVPRTTQIHHHRPVAPTQSIEQALDPALMGDQALGGGDATYGMRPGRQRTVTRNYAAGPAHNYAYPTSYMEQRQYIHQPVSPQHVSPQQQWVPPTPQGTMYPAPMMQPAPSQVSSMLSSPDMIPMTPSAHKRGRTIDSDEDYDDGATVAGGATPQPKRQRTLHKAQSMPIMGRRLKPGPKPKNKSPVMAGQSVFNAADALSPPMPGMPATSSPYRSDRSPMLGSEGDPNEPVSSLPKEVIQSLYTAVAAHMASNGEKIPKRYVCLIDGCDRVFPRKSAIESHIQTHLEDKPFVCREPGWCVPLLPPCLLL